MLNDLQDRAQEAAVHGSTQLQKSNLIMHHHKNIVHATGNTLQLTHIC